MQFLLFFFFSFWLKGTVFHTLDLAPRLACLCLLSKFVGNEISVSFFFFCEDYDPDIVSVDEIKELGKREKGGNKKKSKRIERERERDETKRHLGNQFVTESMTVLRTSLKNKFNMHAVFRKVWQIELNNGFVLWFHLAEYKIFIGVAPFVQFCENQFMTFQQFSNFLRVTNIRGTK